MRLILLVLIAGTVLAQDVTKVVEIHYSDRSRLENLIPLSKSVVTRFDPAGKFVVFQGDAKIVESLEEVLKKIDVPPLNIEFTLELISGSKNPGKASDIPAGLNGVAKEMKNLFGFAISKGTNHHLNCISPGGKESHQPRSRQAARHRLDQPVEALTRGDVITSSAPPDGGAQVPTADCGVTGSCTIQSI